MVTLFLATALVQVLIISSLDHPNSLLTNLLDSNLSLIPIYQLHYSFLLLFSLKSFNGCSPRVVESTLLMQHVRS